MLSSSKLASLVVVFFVDDPIVSDAALEEMVGRIGRGFECDDATMAEALADVRERRAADAPPAAPTAEPVVELAPVRPTFDAVPAVAAPDGAFAIRRPLLPCEPHSSGEHCRYVGSYFGTEARNRHTAEDNATRAALLASCEGSCASCGASPDVEHIIRRGFRTSMCEGFELDADGAETGRILRWTETLCDICRPNRRRYVSVDGAPRCGSLGRFEGQPACSEIAYAACEDESAGEADTSGWYGVTRGPLTAEDVARLAEECGFGRVLPCELSYLTQGAGWIASTNGQGFCTVEPYETAAELETAWKEIEETVAEFFDAAEDEDETSDDDETAEDETPKETEDGYVSCRCRDCMEIAIATPGSAPALCHECEDAGCEALAETECSAPGAYGMGEDEAAEDAAEDAGA